MIKSPQLRFAAALTASAGLVAPLAAESPAAVAPAQSQAGSSTARVDTALTRFAPQADRREHRIDYEHWDEALAWMVVPMGPSVRQGAPRVNPTTGTRRIYGHESRFRLEGNRVAFSFLNDEILTGISDYRAALERVGSDLDLTAIPRNEQLAFWLNLHNVAVVEALAKEYPLSELDASIDDAKLVTVAGVSLSPREIREGIVYPNWRDPKVIYGFWRGAIGGPSIQRIAFTGDNVDALLSLSAEEFVNSLRGVERWGGALRVSPIYQEAEPFYFSENDSLRAHLSQYGREDVRELVSETQQVAYTDLETDIADLSRGEKEMVYSPLQIIQCRGACDPNTIGVSAAISVRNRPHLAIQRLMIERQYKLERAAKRGIRTGMVIYGNGEYSEGEAPPEVE
ncbi:DUF547 domain-containing protein [Erythrobacter sp. KY5]|uniref:DUF547 domain-containing protein n=1 Tax=Erythrobacter sp. KY5 TaxID=2011159 RepID=UPI000DBF1307|nr:DUF547 domain-containing protein [Erythrobacter sp. KY5]AWW75647.1 DUF547 domain-containing protein [Erythrobacter sp. KY5]